MSLNLKIFLIFVIFATYTCALLQKNNKHFTLSKLVKNNGIKKLHRGRILAVGSFSDLKKQVERNLTLDNNKFFRASQIKDRRILYSRDNKRRLTYIF